MPVSAAEDSSLTLEETIQIAKEKNLDLTKAYLNLKSSKLEYQKSMANNLLEQSRYNELKAEIALKTAENTYQDTQYQVVSDIIEQYTSLWLLSFNVEVNEKKSELENRLLEETEAQYEIGDIGSIDLLEQDNDTKDALYSLEKICDDYQLSIMEFNSTLGLGDEEPELVNLKYPQIWQISEEEAINTALKNSVVLKLKDNELHLAQINQERTVISSAELDKKIIDITVEIAQVEKENSKKELINATRKVYYEFKQAIKNMDLKKESLTEAEEKYNLRQEQYQVGLITKTEVLEYEVNMLQAKYDYWSAIANYNLAEQSLKEQMNLESGVLLHDDSEKE